MERPRHLLCAHQDHREETHESEPRHRRAGRDRGRCDGARPVTCVGGRAVHDDLHRAGEGDAAERPWLLAGRLHRPPRGHLRHRAQGELAARPQPGRALADVHAQHVVGVGLQRQRPKLPGPAGADGTLVRAARLRRTFSQRMTTESYGPEFSTRTASTRTTTPNTSCPQLIGVPSTRIRSF